MFIAYLLAFKNDSALNLGKFNKKWQFILAYLVIIN